MEVPEYIEEFVKLCRAARMGLNLHRVGPLTDREKEILKEAAAQGGEIALMPAGIEPGFVLSVYGEPFHAEGDEEAAKLYGEAFQSLCNRGNVDQVDDLKFSLTQEGFRTGLMLND
jgi:hypothetical protein